MSRADRRLPSDIRPIIIESGICLSSQGSSHLKFGNTEVIVNVVGPKECRYREIETDKSRVHVKTYPEMHEINDIIATTVINSLDCEAYPDTTIEISVTIICDNGSLACCAANATVLALFDAGLKLKNKVSSSCFAFKGDVIMLDPTKHEEEVSDGVVTFVYSHEDNKVFSTFFQGSVKPALLMATLANATCNKLTFEKYFK